MGFVGSARRVLSLCVGGLKKTGSSVRGSVLRQLRDGHSGAANTAGETADASDLPGCASRLCVTRDGSKRPKCSAKLLPTRPLLFIPSLVSLFHSLTWPSTAFGRDGWGSRWLCCSIARMRHTGDGPRGEGRAARFSMFAVVFFNARRCQQVAARAGTAVCSPTMI